MPDPQPIPVTKGKKTNVALPPPHDAFSTVVFKQFATLDEDKDGFVRKDDLNRALQNPKFVGDDAAMIAALRAAIGDLDNLVDDVGFDADGVTLADMTEYDRIGAKDPKNATVATARNQFAFAQSKIKSRSPNLFDADPDVLSVRQGMIGDCWLIASVVAVGIIDKAAVRALAKPDPNGKDFIVKFPGVPEEIKITAPTDGEIATYALSNGLWLPVLEKAFGIALQRDSLFFHSNSTLKEIDGGFIKTGLEVVTGSSVDEDELSFTFEGSTRDKLKRAVVKKRAMCAAAHSEIFSDRDQRDNGLPIGHAYSVLGFDEKTDKVKLRNPWGSAGAPFGDVFEMTITEFDTNFSIIAYQE
jgi:hypothetical protein